MADGGVWLVDPLDPGAELWSRVLELGEPRGVIQLLDRHDRDCAALAARLGVPLLVVPVGPLGGSPFETIPLVRSRFWRESALWWLQERILVCGDALGTIGYFLAPGERLAVHPFLRLRPPRRLAALEPLHVLCGHGEGVHGPEAAAVLGQALRTARRRLPAAWLSAARAFLPRGRR